MRRSVSLCAAILLTGCSTTSEWGQTQGGAVYTWHMNSDGSCSLTITSARELQGGADLVIDQNCGVAVSAQRIGSGDTWAPIVSELIKRLP